MTFLLSGYSLELTLVGNVISEMTGNDTKQYIMDCLYSVS